VIDVHMNALQLRTRNKVEIRALILNTARASFVHEGYESFSLRRLARQIGYSPAAIYRHFRDKDEIFFCLTEESFEALVKASSAVVPEEGEDPVSVLKRGMHSYVKFGLDHPDHYRFAFLMAARERKQPPRPRAAYQALRTRVTHCIEAGRFEPGDPDLMAQSLWAAAHGVTSLLVQRPAFPWVAKGKLVSRVIDSAVDALVRDIETASSGGQDGSGIHSGKSAGHRQRKEQRPLR
jgi:AcrR family transcriptional regulator